MVKCLSHISDLGAVRINDNVMGERISSEVITHVNIMSEKGSQ